MYRSYQLEVIQHPEKTAEFRNAHLSRLPLNPPLIVRLIVRDTSGNLVMPEVEIPFLLAHLSLYSEDGQTRLDDPGQWGEDGPPLLYGNLVASLDILEDAPGRQGLFFVFPDVSVRWEGRYQLQLTLMRISR
ncbi:hypothetical protein CYLTODRAFT_429820 [Cylindrobasidium torrendii FP15055 ss-10]|uniref:Velvet domain-containing protein n=1 Tax=Cylindrobasidium torrendii FP15055 ss-10 TaxID=1314674 RepID=A0A0D7BKX0_9AGAR|nr:hypothetical protein CYLTODRAFT_429820 [Cylindrobasidium torrendii FP15055 ss-10]